MAMFLKPIIDKVELNGVTIENYAINIELVTHVQKIITTDYVGILFHGINVTWYYLNSQVKQMEIDYKHIVSNGWKS